ncbi:hypothetical protein ETU10_10995 [Apibacter muscae]|uniref:hypothetical protein n=1 Tax=Apibacter muscae TaxID=2509004 RepID=UPI0011AE13FD|nr:hypothetical protein [Apibacter muscae]TWP22589.1 hypothetical protein ETU10_10995 [Apibacter muscae]
MAMLGEVIKKDTIYYFKEKLIEKCANKFENFATPSLTLRDAKNLPEASNFFNPTSKEIASIFIKGLIHVIKNSKDRITAYTDPDPKPKVITFKSKISVKSKEYYKKIKEYGKNLKIN